MDLSSTRTSRPPDESRGITGNNLGLSPTRPFSRSDGRPRGRDNSSPAYSRLRVRGGPAYQRASCSLHYNGHGVTGLFQTEEAWIA